jgi:hypothetical protein
VYVLVVLAVDRVDDVLAVSHWFPHEREMDIRANGSVRLVLCRSG